MLDVLLNVIVFLFCFFLNGIFGQKSWRNAFLGSEAHAFQHFGLAYYTAVTVRELVEGFVVIPLQTANRSPIPRKVSVKPAIFSYKMVPRLMMACTFFTWFSFFLKVEREAQGTNQVGGAHQYHLFVVGIFPEVGIALDGEEVAPSVGMNIITKSGDWAS